MLKYTIVALVSLALGVLLVLAFAPQTSAHHTGTRRPHKHKTHTASPSPLPSQEAAHAVS